MEGVIILKNFKTKWRPFVLINDRQYRYRYNQNRELTIPFKSDNNDVHIIIRRDYELRGASAILNFILSFLFSVFGLFNPLYDLKAVFLDVNINAVLAKEEGNKIILDFDKKKRKVLVSSNINAVVFKNEFKIGKLAKATSILSLLWQIFAWITIIIIVIYSLINLFTSNIV